MKNLILYLTITTLSVLSYLTYKDYSRRQDRLLEIHLEDKKNKEDKKSFITINNKPYIIRPLTEKEKKEWKKYVKQQIENEKRLNKIIDDLEIKFEKEQKRKDKKEKLEKEIKELEKRGGLTARVKKWFKSFGL